MTATPTPTGKLAALQEEIRAEQRKPTSRRGAAPATSTTKTVRRTRPATKTGNPTQDKTTTRKPTIKSRTPVQSGPPVRSRKTTTRAAAKPGTTRTKAAKGSFDYAYALDHAGNFQVHKPGCRDLKKIETDYDTPGLGTASSYAEMLRDLWADQIRENDSVPDDQKTDEWVLENYDVDVTVSPCLRIPGSAPKPTEKPKAVKAEAKRDLATRVVEAIADMVKSLPDDALALQGMTREEAARCASTWVHHLPADRERWVKVLPKPDRSDWR